MMMIYLETKCRIIDSLEDNLQDYTLSHLENDRDVSAYSGGRRLSSRA